MNELILIGVISICILICSLYTIARTAIKNEKMLEMQIEASKIKKTDHVNTMKFDDITGIINNLINFYTSEEIMRQGIFDKTTDEISLILDKLIIEISTKVTLAMSTELIDAFTNYTTKEHLLEYTKSTTRLNLITRIETKK